MPDFPPPEVLAEVDAAAARVDELARVDRELHFEVDAWTGRVTVQVRDLEGRVIRTISPADALDIIAGREL